jgi:hypothetical protein
MDSIGAFIGLAGGMWVGCILSAVIPLLIPKSPKAMLIVNVLGAGLLLGVAVGVIIPEGVILIYEATLHGRAGHKENHGDEQPNEIVVHGINDIGT